MSQMPLWLLYVQVGAQVAIGVGTLCLLVLTLRNTKWLKKADVLIEVHRRFDALAAECEQLATKDRCDPVGYFGRFWSFQSQEFDFWQRGLIDDSLYKGWAQSRKVEFHNAHTVCGVTYLDGWRQVRQDFSHKPAFVDFVDGLAGEQDIGDLMNRGRRKRLLA